MGVSYIISVKILIMMIKKHSTTHYFRKFLYWKKQVVLEMIQLREVELENIKFPSANSG